MKSNLAKFFVPAVMVLGVAGCNKPAPINVPDLVTTPKVIQFSEGGNDEFFASHGYGNDDPFNVTWNQDNATISNNQLHLQINEAPEGNEHPYYGGEYRSKKFYGYGDFGVRMKPASRSGTCSTFYIYTGEWDSEELHPSTGENDTRNPDNLEGKHDEIDIEFVGNDTTKVQFNYFTGGKGNHEYFYHLGFDASKEFHDYGFRWEKDKITWFVDGKAVYQVTSDIPTHPGRILTNFWTSINATTDGKEENWMGKYDKSGKNTNTSDYEWFSATSASTAKETHKEEELEDQPFVDPIDWSEYDAIDVKKAGGDVEYETVIAQDKKSVEITYDAVGQSTWKNVSFSLPEERKAARVLEFTAQNKGDKVVALRADVNETATHGEHEITAVNTSARQDGKLVSTDLDWGGSRFDLAANSTSVCRIEYDADAVSLQFMIDSIANTAATTNAGDIVISNIKLNDKTPIEEEDTGDEIDWSKVSAIDIENVTATDVYTTQISEDKKSVDIQYTAAKYQTYADVKIQLPVNTNQNGIIRFELENKGETNNRVRGDVLATATHGAHDINVVNTSATQDGEAVSTDLEWGGSSFISKANKTVVCEIEYNDVAVTLALLFDSMYDDDITTEHAGHIVVKNIKMIAVEKEEEVVPTDKKVALAFASQGGYTCSVANDATTITYESIFSDTYANTSCGVEGAGYNTLELDFENKGAENVQIMVDFQASTTSCLVKRGNTEEAQFAPYDYFDGKAQYNIAPGATRHLVFAYNGDLTTIVMFINSGWTEAGSADESARTEHKDGNMVISNVTLKYVA